MNLSAEDLIKLAKLSKAINRTAYYGGLMYVPHAEVGQFIGLFDRILKHHGTTVDELVKPTQATLEQQLDAMAAGLRRSGLDR